MSTYSETMGSFVRTSNFPLEADYIFSTETALKEFYAKAENAVILHKGLLKIVEKDADGNQALYWVTKNSTTGALEFSKIATSAQPSTGVYGSPAPTTQFSTLRGIEDVVRALNNTHTDDINNLQGEINLTQSGVGLDSDGKYSPDLETHYLKDSTSVMNALKTLDSLLYTALNGGTSPTDPDFSITKFSGSPAAGNYEAGTSITPTLTWAYTTTVDSQTLTDATLTADDRTFTAAAALTRNKTYTLSAKKGTHTHTSSIAYNFYAKMYYGTLSVSDIETVTEDQIEGLSNSRLATSRSLNRQVFDCSTNNYIYYAIPTSMTTGIVFKDASGNTTNAYSTRVMNITNTNNVTTEYTIYKLNNAYHSSSVILTIE